MDPVMAPAQPVDPVVVNSVPALRSKSRIAGWFYGHRKMLVFLGAFLLLYLNKRLGLMLDDKTLEWLAGLTMAYMGANVGEHFADAFKLKVILPLLEQNILQARRPIITPVVTPPNPIT